MFSRSQPRPRESKESRLRRLGGNIFDDYATPRSVDDDPSRQASRLSYDRGGPRLAGVPDYGSTFADEAPAQPLRASRSSLTSDADNGPSRRQISGSSGNETTPVKLKRMDHQDSIFYFVIVFPEMYRHRFGTYWSVQVCASILVFLLTAMCQIGIVNVAGGFIVNAKFNEFKSTLTLPLDIEAPEYVAKKIPGVKHKSDQCCSNFSCADQMPCCIMDSNGSIDRVAKTVMPSQMGSLCRGSVGEGSLELDCSPPSFQLVGRWSHLDVNGDGVWSQEEASTDAMNLACRFQLSGEEIFRTACVGIAKDVDYKRSLGFLTPAVPPEIRSMSMIPQKYFEVWEGIVLLCSVMDVARCGGLVKAGVFDGMLNRSMKYFADAHPEQGSSWQRKFHLNHALEYCYHLLSPGGICDTSMPLTFALHRQMTQQKCGAARLTQGDIVQNTYNPRDVLRVAGVKYESVRTYESVHSFAFRVFLWINLILWLVTLDEEKDSIWALFDFVLCFPRCPDQNPLRIPTDSLSVASLRNSISDFRARIHKNDRTGWSLWIVEQGGEVVIHDLSDVHRCTCIFMLIVRAINFCILALVGVVYATFTHSYLDILMNTVALAFVFELPGIFYIYLIPRSVKDPFEGTQIAPWESELSKALKKHCFPPVFKALKNKYVQGLIFMPFLCLCIVEISDRYSTQPMLEVLRCACMQSGDGCLIAEKLTGAWWNGHWQSVHDVA